MSKAHGLYLECWPGEHRGPLASSAVLDRGSKHRTGATVSSRMAQSRYASAGELLACRPIVRDTKALPVVGVIREITPTRASDKGVQRAS
jgi:hypothetical protein